MNEIVGFIKKCGERRNVSQHICGYTTSFHTFASTRGHYNFRYNFVTFQMDIAVIYITYCVVSRYSFVWYFHFTFISLASIFSPVQIPTAIFSYALTFFNKYQGSM